MEHTKRLSTASGSTSTLDSAGGKTGQIRILAPSGDHFEVTVSSSMRIYDLKTEIFNSWPKELLHEEKPESVDCLKFLYQGRFQSDEAFIRDLSLALEEVITIHLFISPVLQIGEDKNSNTGWCSYCTIS